MASKYNETRANAERENNKLLNLLFSRTKKKLTKEFERVYTEAIKKYDDGGIIPVTLYEEHRDNLLVVLHEMYFRATTAGQKRILQTFVKAGWIKKDEQQPIKDKYEKIFKSYSEQRARFFANKIAKTTEDDITRIIEKDKKQANGNLLGALKDALRDAKNRSIFRTVVVGLTSIHSAISFSQRTTAGEMENSEFLLYKEWVTEKDEVVRDDHIVMEGVRVPIHEDFIVGGEPMREPGDDSASLKQRINCRCFLRYRRERR